MFRKIIKGLEENLSDTCMDSVIPTKSLIVGFHFRKFERFEPTTFPQKLHHDVFFGVWQIFSE